MKEEKKFKICPECNASVRDINYDYHMAKVHGIGSLDKIKKPKSKKKKKKTQPGINFVKRLVEHGFKGIFDYAQKKNLTMSQVDELVEQLSNIPPEFIQGLYAIEGLRAALIMEYAFLRRDLGLAEITVDHNSKNVKINIKQKDNDRIFKEYIRESKFIDLGRELFFEKEEGLKLPKKEDINSKKVSKVASDLGIKRNKLLNIIKETPNKDIFRFDNGKIYVGKKYDDFREWFTPFYDRYKNSLEISDLFLDEEYSIVMDGIKDINKIINRIGEEINDIIMGNAEKIKPGTFESAPLELNDLISLVQQSESMEKTGRLLEGTI